eukprot:scaffold203062_cov70-Attheya_sp.AAC.4
MEGADDDTSGGKESLVGNGDDFEYSQCRIKRRRSDWNQAAGWTIRVPIDAPRPCGSNPGCVFLNPRSPSRVIPPFVPSQLS